MTPMLLPFRYLGSRIEIENGRALGRERGLTGRGVIDLAGNRIDRLFEVDVFERIEEQVTRETVTLAFKVR